MQKTAAEQEAQFERFEKHLQEIESYREGSDKDPRRLPSYLAGRVPEIMATRSILADCQTQLLIYLREELRNFGGRLSMERRNDLMRACNDLVPVLYAVDRLIERVLP